MVLIFLFIFIISKALLNEMKADHNNIHLNNVYTVIMLYVGNYNSNPTRIHLRPFFHSKSTYSIGLSSLSLFLSLPLFPPSHLNPTSLFNPCTFATTKIHKSLPSPDLTMKDLHGHRSFQVLRLLVLSLCVYLAMADCPEVTIGDKSKYRNLSRTLRRYFGLKRTGCFLHT